MAGTRNEAGFNPWPILVIAALAALLIYGWECAFRPFVPCAWCEESGRRPRLVFKGTRQCRHCRGEGQRLILGRALWVRLKHRRQRAAKARSEL